MKLSETILVADDAKIQWIDDNIRRLSTVIHLEGKMLDECKLDETNRRRIQTQRALNENELDRFKEMAKGPKHELQD